MTTNCQRILLTNALFTTDHVLCQTSRSTCSFYLYNWQAITTSLALAERLMPTWHIAEQRTAMKLAAKLLSSQQQSYVTDLSFPMHSFDFDVAVTITFRIRLTHTWKPNYVLQWRSECRFTNCPYLSRHTGSNDRPFFVFTHSALRTKERNRSKVG